MVADPFQLIADLGVVVNLSVERNPKGPVLIGHGLLAGPQVNNGKATMAQSHRMIVTDVNTIVIGPSVANDVVHLFYFGSLNAPRVNISGNTAHLKIWAPLFD